VERFLFPFNCNSMNDFGLYGEADGNPRLVRINDDPKSRALLRLLDLTIGTTENAVVPYDLSEALAQVRRASPVLANTPAYADLPLQRGAEIRSRLLAAESSLPFAVGGRQRLVSSTAV
jgi:hypothetical protein